MKSRRFTKHMTYQIRTAYSRFISLSSSTLNWKVLGLCEFSCYWAERSHQDGVCGSGGGGLLIFNLDTIWGGQSVRVHASSV